MAMLIALFVAAAAFFFVFLEELLISFCCILVAVILAVPLTTFERIFAPIVNLTKLT